MSMIINTNIQATRTHNVYNKNNEYMNQALTRVATGMKINSAKDGASDWAISEKMRERIRANDQANQNVQNDTAMLKTAQGGIANTIDILKTLKERAINASNDSNLNSDRSAIATEIYQLVEQINDNAAKVKFNGRVLLNGESDTTVGSLNGETAAASSAITEPEAAEFKGTVDPGSNAVLGLDFTDKILGKDQAAITTTTKLVDLEAKDGENLGIKAGDLIKFTWEENGEAKQQTFQVANSTTLADLAFETSALKMTFDATAPTSLTDADSTTVKDADGTTDTTGVVGLNAVGTGDTQITNFKVAVTYDDNGTETTRTEAQAALKFEGVQQAKEPVTGSHSVFKIDKVSEYDSVGSTWKSTAATTDTTLASLGLGDSNATPAPAGATTFKVTVDGKESEVTLASTDTLGKLQTEFKKLGITVQLAAKDDNVVDSNKTKVTQNTLDGTEELKASVTTTGNSGTANRALYFVADSGKNIDKITTTNTKVTLEQIQKFKGEEEAAANGASTDLVFYIGGESNFGMNVSIKSMNMDSLFGTDTKNFSKMFLSKEALDKGDGKTDVIGMIDNALSTAMTEQTKLGAIENRLGYTSDNLTTMNENLEAANSAMRDSDIAKEMTNYMRYAVLSQASQYMLAQTGQNAFSVLNLLQA